MHVFEQLMFGKPRYITELKPIQAYNNRLRYCLLVFSYMLAWRKMTQINVYFSYIRLPTDVLMPFILGNILMLNEQTVPIFSHVYTTPIATNIFNFKHVLQDLNIDDFKSNHHDWTCASSLFTFNPVDHVITGDLNTIYQQSQALVYLLSTLIYTCVDRDKCLCQQHFSTRRTELSRA